MAEVLILAELDRAGLAAQVSVESAGTGDWHIGEHMDSRASAELARRGHDGSFHRARQIAPDWLDRFDLLIAMDAQNLRALRLMADGRPDVADRIRLFLSFDSLSAQDAQVPDPYGGGPDQFAQVFDMMAAAARGLVDQLAALLGERADG